MRLNQQQLTNRERQLYFQTKKCIKYKNIDRGDANREYALFVLDGGSQGYNRLHFLLLRFVIMYRAKCKNVNRALCVHFMLMVLYTN